MIINKLPALEVYSVPGNASRAIIKKINSIEDIDAVLLDTERKQRRESGSQPEDSHSKRENSSTNKHDDGSSDSKSHVDVTV